MYKFSHKFKVYLTINLNNFFRALSARIFKQHFKDMLKYIDYTEHGKAYIAIIISLHYITSV